MPSISPFDSLEDRIAFLETRAKCHRRVDLERVMLLGEVVKKSIGHLKCGQLQLRDGQARLVADAATLENRCRRTNKTATSLVMTHMEQLDSILKLHVDRDTILKRVETLVGKLVVRISSLESQVKEFTCVLCYVRARNACLMPCSHGQFCSTCINKMFTDMSSGGEDAIPCPICRVPANSFVIIRN